MTTVDHIRAVQDAHERLYAHIRELEDTGIRAMLLRQILDRKLLTVAQLARGLGVSRSRVYEMLGQRGRNVTDT